MEQRDQASYLRGEDLLLVLIFVLFLSLQSFIICCAVMMCVILFGAHLI